MRGKSLFPILLIVAGLMLLSVAGYCLVSDRLASDGSRLEIGFIEPESLTKMKSYSTNRLTLQIRNPTSTTARIVGSDAC